MSPGLVYLAKKRAYESFVPPVLVGPTECQTIPVPFIPDSGSSFTFVFTPIQLAFSINLIMDAYNFYIHVAIRHGYFLMDYYKDGRWRHLPADIVYPGIVGQVQEVTLAIYSDHCQVLLDNKFIGQFESPHKASKITKIVFCPENAFVEWHSVECKDTS
ncbi:uncharacterized protein LOC128207804 [Mya arenaria]|uniref:uncharacterized protein LOC128207804 n=1 Tax=Mya arenaria TaxID=6604 RepID=UPI0022E04A1D|nr:uncharacterized protein LOC128207804 [Mya arenaria]